MMYPLFFAGPDDCSFEYESKFPCHWYNISGYSLRWIRYSGSTPSYNTGPTGDATVGFDGSKSVIHQSAKFWIFSRKGNYIHFEVCISHYEYINLLFYAPKNRKRLSSYQRKENLNRAYWAFCTIAVARILQNNSIEYATVPYTLDIP